MKWLFYTLLSIFCTIYVAVAYGKNEKDSAGKVLSGIYLTYKKGKLSEKEYLDSVYATMRSLLPTGIGFSNKELQQILAPYRAVIWNNKNNEEHKRDYYGIFSNQAQLASRNGEMLYYAEKIDSLERKINNRPSLTALSIIAGYYEIHHAFNKVRALLDKEKTYLLQIPGIALTGSMSGKELVQATITMGKWVKALYELKDTLEGDKAQAILEKLAKITIDQHKADPIIVANIILAQNTAFYNNATARKKREAQWEGIRKMEDQLFDNSTPDYLKYHIYSTLTDWKVEYFLSQNNRDSAVHYMDIYEELTTNDFNPYNKYRQKKYRARDFYYNGQYKEAADMLEASIIELDTSQALLVKDMDDILYAQAKAEDQQLLLADAEASRSKTEKVLILTGTIAFLLLSAGLFAFLYVRRRQKARFLEFKLNMARNIHDETNPALLYAKALLKSVSADNNNGSINTELGNHIDHTMALIRSLSHDLKSDKQYTLNDLVTKTRKTLEKLNVNDEFKYIIQEKTERKRFVSYYQFAQLTSILNECMTNTIKHASFDKIDITFASTGNKLTITYKDNGHGWETPRPNLGIGVKNMEERVRQINGDWKIDNEYPHGYQINISVVLR